MMNFKGVRRAVADPGRRTTLALRICYTLAVVCLTLAGCSGRPRPYPTSGKIVFADGQPLAGGRIEVRSLEHALVARGAVAKDGTFELTTYAPGDGAVAGEHQVLIVQKFAADIDNMQKHMEHATRTRTLARRFSKYATSGLTLKVAPGGDNSSIVLTVDSE